MWTGSFRASFSRVILAIAPLLVACGGAGFDGRLFESDELAFRVSGIPESWRRIEAQGALLAFRDDEAAASIAVNGRCNKDGDDVPLRALTHHLFIHFTDRQLETQERFELDGRAALHTGMRARLDGVEKRVDVVVLKKNRCVYDFFHVAPPGRGDDSRERFLAFVRGFSTVRP